MAPRIQLFQPKIRFLGFEIYQEMIKPIGTLYGVSGEGDAML